MRHETRVVSRRAFASGLLVMLLAAVALMSEVALAQERTAFENVRVIAGDRGDAMTNQTVVIEGQRIVQVGASDAIRISPATRRVDMTGKTLMPALIDTHVHVNQPRSALERDLRRLAYFGVGTVLSLGVDTDNAPFELRAQPVQGAARLLTAGRGITGPEPGRETAPYWVTTREEAVRAVEENAKRQVDVIKIWVDDRGGTVRKLPPPLFQAIIEAAHARGLQVSAHVLTLEDARSLLRADVDAFAHSVRDREIDDAFVDLLRHHHAFVLNPNLSYRGEPTDLTWLERLIPSDDFKSAQAKNAPRREAKASFAIQAKNLLRMRDAGARIVLGTDTSFDFPGGNAPWNAHIELEDMVAAGLSTSEAIVAASANAAAFLKLKDRGLIREGYQADFLVLDGDPLENITNTRRIADVYLGGVKVDRTRYPQ